MSKIRGASSANGAISITTVVFASLICLPYASAAQDWEYSVAPYIWGAGVDGRLGSPPDLLDVNADFSDIFDNLDGGLLLHGEAKRGRWTILGDIVALDLGTELQQTEGEADVEQTFFELGGAYAVGDDFDVLFGARLTDLDNEIDVFQPNQPAQRLESAESWVDPFVGGRWHPRINDRWSLWLRGDVAGFGIGSDFTWNASAVLAFEATRAITLGLGYRILDIDFDDDGFVYDVQMPGLLLGVEFQF